MPGLKNVNAAFPSAVNISDWTYEGDQALAGNDASQNLTIPAGANIAVMRPEAGAAYFAVNGAASSGSGGYMPEDAGDVVGPIDNLTSIGVWAATGTTVHVLYFSS